MLDKKENRKNIKEFTTVLAKDLKNLREDRRLSIEELAIKAEISLAKLMYMEAGSNLNWGIIFQLARFYEKKLGCVFL